LSRGGRRFAPNVGGPGWGLEGAVNGPTIGGVEMLGVGEAGSDPLNCSDAGGDHVTVNPANKITPTASTHTTPCLARDTSATRSSARTSVQLHTPFRQTLSYLPFKVVRDP
jgi:hypothetical protein